MLSTAPDPGFSARICQSMSIPKASLSLFHLPRASSHTRMARDGLVLVTAARHDCHIVPLPRPQQRVWLSSCAISALALGRRSWLTAGSDRCGRRTAAMYTLIGAVKPNNVDPQA